MSSGFSASQSLGLPDEDRRSSNVDRRNQHRSGKYDRRKNRCGGCQFFVPAQGGQVAQCQQGQVTTLDVDTFACLVFEPITAE